MKAEEMRADYSVLKTPETMASGWHRVRLGDIAEVVRGVTYKKEQASEKPARGRLPILRATNIQDGVLVLDSDVVYVPTDLVSDTQRLRVGDIVVATSSGSKHLVGKAAQVKETWEGSFGAFCAAIRPTTDIDHRYLGYFFESREYKDYIVKKALGVNINNLRRGDVEEISVPVAPLDQQKRIVAEIEKQYSRLDEAVANLKRVKANLKRYKAAVLKAAVEGRLVETEAELARCEGRSFETGAQLLQRILETRRSRWQGKGKYKEPVTPDTTDLPKLPEGWVVASLEQLTSSERVICYGILMPKENVLDGVLYVKVRDLKGDKVNLDSLQRTLPEIAAKYARASLKTGDLLLAIRGTYGRIAEVPPELDGGSITQDTARLAVSPLIDRNYVAWFLRSLDAQNFFKRVARGVAVKGVNIADVRVCPIFLPSLLEQRRIVAEVDRRLSLLRETEAQADVNLLRAERLRQSILAHAFSGRFRTGEETWQTSSGLWFGASSVPEAPAKLNRQRSN